MGREKTTVTGGEDKKPHIGGETADEATLRSGADREGEEGGLEGENWQKDPAPLNRDLVGALA